MGNRVTYSHNPDTGKRRLVPLNFYNYITTENLELGPVGLLNTD